jgi:hypothetical protein
MIRRAGAICVLVGRVNAGALSRRARVLATVIC